MGMYSWLHGVVKTNSKDQLRNVEEEERKLASNVSYSCTLSMVEVAQNRIKNVCAVQLHEQHIAYESGKMM